MGGPLQVVHFNESFTEELFRDESCHVKAKCRAGLPEWLHFSPNAAAPRRVRTRQATRVSREHRLFQRFQPHMTTAPETSGDHSPGDEPQKSPEQVPPAAAAESKKSVFSDNFDDPERRASDDELPEDEPLTPELVEEEAIRGDFMLRWAVICLAALMAFTCISDTKPLVLIRSGEQMRQNGFLPRHRPAVAHDGRQKHLERRLAV